MAESSLDRLLAVMARLRDPQNGCPWDLEQDFKSIAPHTLEETYEVVEAIESGAMDHVREELGDLLFQIVFYAQMGREAGLFDFDAIADGVATKMIERHPHVFGDRDAATAADVLRNWEADKAAKRAAKNDDDKKPVSALDGVSEALPAATRALKLQKRAARVGFDWSNPKDIFAKIREELDELEAEINAADKDKMEDELGDVFFVIVNLARHLDLDPETALRRTNRKFTRRFQFIENALAAQGQALAGTSLDTMEQLWNDAKREEKR